MWLEESPASTEAAAWTGVVAEMRLGGCGDSGGGNLALVGGLETATLEFVGSAE